MPTYTIDIIGVTGTSWTTFTSLGVVGTITFTDEDSLGVGDNLPDTETGALPVITGVSGTLPASWVGQTLSFGWQQQIDGSGGPDALGMVIGGGSNFISTHLVQYPGGTPIVDGATYTASGIENVPNEVIVCFTKGTRILTTTGYALIEDLEIGDMVVTAKSGAKPIKWIGSAKRFAQGDLAPIVFKKSAIGNTAELRVSPQHRILLSGWQAELMFGEDEVLVPAKSLVNDTTILREVGGTVDYFHIMFDQHQIVFAEDVPSESFHPSKQSISTLGDAARKEIFELFPQLRKQKHRQKIPTARPALSVSEGRLMAQIMHKP